MEDDKSMSLKTFSVLAVLVALALVFVLDETSYSRETISFQHGGDTLTGLLVTPKTVGPHPCIVLVHGDGPKTSDGGGAYEVPMRCFSRNLPRPVGAC